MCDDITRLRSGANDGYSRSHATPGEEDWPRSWKVTHTSGSEGRREIKEEEEDKGEKVAAVAVVVAGGACKDGGRRRGM